MEYISIIIVVLIVIALYIPMLYKNRKRATRKPEPLIIEYDTSELKDLKITVPEPKLTCAGFHNEDTQFRAIINESMLDVEPQEAYPWILLVHADLKHVDKEGFPKEKEAQNILFFYHMLDEDLAIDKQYPNAVFLGRVVAKGHEVLHWYIHDADIADRIMYRLSLCKNPPVKFDYEIKDDKDWEYAHCLIDPLKTTPETEPNNNFNF